MKITKYDTEFSARLGSGDTTLVSGFSGGSNGGFGPDVTGSWGDLSVVGLRQLVSISSNAGDSTVGTVLTTIQASPWVAAFAVPSNTGGSGNDTSLVTVAATGSTETVDVSVARTYDLTLDADCTLTLTGAVTAEAWFVTLVLRQDGTGGWTVTWPGSVSWLNGTAPTLTTTPGDLDTITLFTLDGGTNWFGATADSSVASHLTDPTDAHDASAISIADAGGYYTGTDVEAALQEIGAGGIGGGGGEDTDLVIVNATGATETLDVTTARAYDVTLDTDCTFSLTGPATLTRHEMTLIVRQDSTGGWTVTWPGEVHWPGGVTPTLASGAYDADLFRLITTSGGTEWLGIHDGAAYALTSSPHVGSGSGGTFPLVWLNGNL